MIVRSGVITSTVAVAVPPVPPSLEVTGSVVLTWVPVAIARTSTEKVQLLLARIVPPTRLMLLGAVVITPGSQLPTMLSGLAIIIPAGKLSFRLTPVRSVAPLGLVIVKVSVTLWFNPTCAALNDLVTAGGDTTIANPGHAQIIKLTARINRLIWRARHTTFMIFSRKDADIVLAFAQAARKKIQRNCYLSIDCANENPPLLATED